MPVSYTLKDNIVVEAKVTFLRVKPNGKKQTLTEIHSKLSNLSWVNNLASAALRASYNVRVDRTLQKIVELIDGSAAEYPITDDVVSDAAEYIVSVVASDAVVNELQYREIPLPEAFKHQRSQNPGFDFFSINAADVLLFGEAKYVKGGNAYGNALKQIVRFVTEQNDIADLADVYLFVDEAILNRVIGGEKGFMAAFSSTNLATNELIANIKVNGYYDSAKQHKELILIAVDML